MKLTIIIPVYNAEKYLQKCLESVFNQNLLSNQYEVICVNDGSTDNSGKILLDFSNRFSNLVYLKQENKGVSIARNKGLQIAKGKYILFLDADDYIESNILNDIVSISEENNLDILYLKINYVNEVDEVIGEFKMDSEEILIQDGFTHQRRGFIVSLYKKETVGNISFEKDVIIAEDALFNIMVHTFAKRISYYPKKSYYYRKYSSSSSQNIQNIQSQKAFDGMIKNIICLHNFVQSQKYNLTEEQLKYYNRPFYLLSEMILSANIIPVISRKRLKTLKKTLNELNLDDTRKQIIKNFFWYNKPTFMFIFFYKLKSIIKR